MEKEYTFRRWGTWGILVLTFVSVFFHRMSTGAVADDLVKNLNINGATLGNLTAMNYYAYAIMQIPVGIMVDTIGVRKICTWGTLITGIGSILFGIATGIELAYIGRFLVGLGTSVIIVSIMKVQTQWFKPNQFSTLSGITSFVGNFGALLATFPLTYMVVQLGWRNSFYFMGFISIVLAIGIWIIVREYPAGLQLEKNHQKPAGKKTLQGVQQVLVNPYTWPPFFIMFTLVGATTAITGLWGIPYVTHVYGIPKQEAAWYMSFITFGFIIGSPIIGKLSDTLGGKIKKILMISTACYTLIWIYLIAVGGKPPIHVLPFLFLGIGLSMIPHILVFTNAKEVNDLAFAGSAIAIVNVGEFAGGSVLSWGIGALLDFGWTGKMVDGARIYDVKQYQMAFILVAVMGAISFISTILMKDESEKRKCVNEGTNEGTKVVI